MCPCILCTIAGIAIASAVAVAALIAFIVLLVRKPPLRQRLSGGFRVASQDEQHKPPHMPAHMPAHNGPDSGSDAGWQRSVPDDEVATTTPDITQKQMPLASKVRPSVWGRFIAIYD
jgi:hypothetical protein